MTGAARPGLAVFGAIWFCYFAAIGAFNPYAPLWFQELGFSTLAIGAIASLQSWTRVIAPYAWGWFGDRGGQRARLVRWAALGSMLAAAGLLVARGYGAVVVCTVLLFVANGGVVPLSEATLARHLKTADGVDSARYGRVRVWGSLGFIVAVLAGGALLQAGGIGWFPWLALGVFALLWLATLRLPLGPEDVCGHAEAPAIHSVLRRPEVAWFFASVFFTVLAHTSLYAFFSLYVDRLGYSKSAVGLLWAVSVAAEIVFFWTQGRFFDRWSPQRWLLAAAGLSVLRFAAVAAFGELPAVLVGSQLLHAVTFAAHHAACIQLISRYFPGPLRGRGQALYSTLGYGVSGVIGGVAGGWLSTAHGFPAVFWAAALAALFGAVCAQLASRPGRARPGAAEALR
jgi:MFS transporter, PPP family, 3-phenylpropionic acid transporter